MPNALKKINARAKQLKKMPKNKNKKYRTLQKQAAGEYNKGKLGTKKKPAKKKTVHRKKRHVTKKKTVHRKRTRHAKPKVIRRRTVVVYKTKKRSSRRRSVSGFGKLKKILPIAVLAVGGYLLLKPKPAVPPIVQTTNPVRNQTANNILLYAQAASMGLTEIAKLINTINSANDAQVQKIYDNVRSGTDPYANIAGIGTRPVLVRAMQ